MSQFNRGLLSDHVESGQSPSSLSSVNILSSMADSGKFKSLPGEPTIAGRLKMMQDVLASLQKNGVPITRAVIEGLEKQMGTSKLLGLGGAGLLSMPSDNQVGN